MQRSKLTLRAKYTRIDFISGFVAVVVVESRIIFSSLSVKNAHIWEIDFDETNLEMIQTSEQPKIFSFNGPSFKIPIILRSKLGEITSVSKLLNHSTNS